MTAERPPLPQDIQGLAPSAGHVWNILIRDGPLTRRALMARTGRSESTVDDALGALKEHGWVDSEFSPNDGCQLQYRAFKQPRDSGPSET